MDCFPLQLMKTGTRATAMEVLASSQNPTSEHKDIHLNLIVNRQLHVYFWQYIFITIE